MIDERASRADYELRCELADDVFAGLVGTPPIAIRLLAQALGLAGGAIGRFGPPLEDIAVVMEQRREDIPWAGLPRIRMVYAFHRALGDPDIDGLLERLERQEAAPWPQIAAALNTLRDTRETE